MDRLRRGRRRRMSRPRGRGPTTVRASDSADEKHLADFASTRRGVEGFVEPRTAVTDVGYPARMREYNLRQKDAGS